MRKQPKIIKTDEWMRNLVYSLLANCIGEYSRLADMREELRVVDLPADMPEARQLLTALQMADEAQLEPTEDKLTYLMTKEMNLNEEKVKENLHNIMAFQTNDRAVDGLSVMVGMDVQRRRIEQAKEEAINVLDNGEGKLAERLDTAITTLSAVNDQGNDDSVKSSQSELATKHKEIMRKRVANRKSGTPSGPNLKFLGFIGERDAETGLWKEGREGKIPVLRWGSTTVCTALPGYGKSTLGGIWAEHNAHKLGIDVLYVHNETEQEDFFDRMITRNTLVPTDYLVNQFDIDNKDDRAYQKVTEYYDKLENTLGDITFLYCPGWNVFKINAAIGLARRLADRRGRGLLVIMDYYNLIDATNFSGERSERLGQVAFNLREAIKRENLKSKKAGGIGVHCIVFAQETDNKQTGEVYAFGSKEILQYAQIHISINRTVATADVGMNGSLNSVGGLRYWCRAGELSHVIALRILKANYDSRGDVTVWMENNMVQIYNPPPTTGAPVKL